MRVDDEHSVDVGFMTANHVVTGQAKHGVDLKGAISEGVHVGDPRRSRYSGLAKPHPHHVLTAAGLDVLRVGAWFAATPPHAPAPRRLRYPVRVAS